MMTQVWNADLCSHRKGGSIKIPSPPREQPGRAGGGEQPPGVCWEGIPGPPRPLHLLRSQPWDA